MEGFVALRKKYRIPNRTKFVRKIYHPRRISSLLSHSFLSDKISVQPGNEAKQDGSNKRDNNKQDKIYILAS